MNPKHIKYIQDENRRAVAPYNFVELPDTIVEAESLPDHNRYDCLRYTGRIECTLTTSSPLYIRGGFTPNDFAKFSEQPCSVDQLRQLLPEERGRRTDFFKHPQSQGPTIPGSSLRGMLRTLVEMVSYGKLDRVSDTNLVYRAVGDTTSLGKDYRARLNLNGQFQQKAG